MAFSGGLDTSFCVPWLKDTYQRPVITVTVDTGGIDAAAAQSLAERSAQLGAIEHHLIDARTAYFEQVLKFLIMGNVRRGNVYPLCVGAERVLQAQTIAQMALSLETKMVAHGCTAAGNDQVRFEVALRTLAPDLEIIAPVRDRAFKRPEQLKYLEEHGLPIPPFGAAYSVNRGLWGVTIGGKETLTSEGSIPDDAVGAVEGRLLSAARGRAASHRIYAGRAGQSRRPAPAAGRHHRSARNRSPAPSASAAAFTWAIPSSVPRAGSPSKRPPPTCC